MREIGQALLDLESSSDLKHKALFFQAAKEVEIKQGKKAVILFVPYRNLKNYHERSENFLRIIRELEKKFSKQFVVIAQRRIIRKTPSDNKKKMQKRPDSRTVKKVHEAILDDLVFPAEIIGKRTRVRLDGSKLLKVHLDNKEKN